jgi:hypothetical protein
MIHLTSISRLEIDTRLAAALVTNSLPFPFRQSPLTSVIMRGEAKRYENSLLFFSRRREACN